MNIPVTGINKTKANFFLEIARAFEILSIYHSIDEAKQQELLEFLTYLQAKK
jgi:hypothetical protein